MIDRLSDNGIVDTDKVDTCPISHLSGVIDGLCKELDARRASQVGRVVDLLGEASHKIQCISCGLNNESIAFPRLSRLGQNAPRIARAQYVRDAVIEGLAKSDKRKASLEGRKFDIQSRWAHFDKSMQIKLRLRLQEIKQKYDAAIYSHECLERALGCLNEALSLQASQWAVDNNEDLVREAAAKRVLSKISAKLSKISARAQKLSERAQKLKEIEQFQDAAKEAATQALIEIKSVLQAALLAIPQRGDIASMSVSGGSLELTFLKGGRPIVTYVVSAHTDPLVAQGSPIFDFIVQVTRGATGGRMKEVICKDSQELTELLLDAIVDHAVKNTGSA